MNDIDLLIGDVRARWRRARAGEAVFATAAPLAAAALVLVVLDNLLHLPPALRWAGAAAFVGAAAWLAWTKLRPAATFAPSDDEVALLIEKSIPTLDNQLINTVQFRREEMTGFGAAVAQKVDADASAAAAEVVTGGIVSVRALRRAGIAAAGAVALVALYAAVFPGHFVNAVQRYARPGAFVAPITSTRLAVAPGDVTVVEGSSVAVRATATGTVPETAALTVKDAAGATTYDMPFAGDAFAFELKDLRASVAYSVAAGDAESATFHVAVVERPRIAHLVIESRWPDYLGRPPRRDDPADGNVAGVRGTHVVVAATANRRMSAAAVEFTSGRKVDVKLDGAELACEFDIVANDRWRVVLTDEAGLVDPEPPTWSVTALPDAPPTVVFRAPTGKLAVAADAEFTAEIEAKDDVGLAEASLRVLRGKEETVLETWPMDGKLTVRVAHLVRLAPLKVAPGETIALIARARDLKGQEAASRPLLVTVLSGRQETEQLGKELASLVARLRAVLAKERAARTEAGRGVAVALAQREILALTTGVLADWTDPKLLHVAARGKVQGLVADEMPAAVKQTGPALLATQDVIVRVLAEVVGELERLLDAVKSGEIDKALQDAAPVDASAAAKDLLRGLREFVDEQKRLIELSQALSGIAPEDLTDDEKKRLDALTATEEKWGRFLQEKVTDLSKLPPQDFSDGTVLKELIEAHSDVELAADALSGKKVEVAVPLEEAGLELAKSLTTNIERWLADVPDQIKWNMEEPATQPEVPMADLPEQLEDLVGDLIDQEEAMTEETEDVTSSWMDSINEGAGWTAMDGPISNMSAKGITGNLNPNSQEVGGRSGEGRAGKSSGQMVEESASGKGGRQTPTRVTADPYEKGQVKDTSKDPTGGATGGGKESGGNKQGLRGVPPPETQRKMDRLADQQADVRNASEKVKAALDRRGYHAADLAKAIERMRYLEDQLRKGRGGDYGALQREVVENLSVAKRTAGDTLAASRDPGHGLPRELRDEILNALDEPLPKDFEDAIKAYYRALAEGR